MAVKIRLKRIGRCNRPFYRVCVFDGKTRRDGRPIEELGSYDPRGETLADKVSIDRRRAHYWLTVGAQPSATCASLLRRLGVRKDAPVPEEEPVVGAVAADAAGDVPVEAGSAVSAPEAATAVVTETEAPAAADVEPPLTTGSATPEKSEQ